MTDPYESEEYQKFVEDMVQFCECESMYARPCDGVLAGGLCDRQLDCEYFNDYDEEDLCH